MLKQFIGTKAFYKNILKVMIPILIQNGITNFISLLDNVMVGQVGTEQMSGVSIVNQLLFVFNLAVFGAISGAGLFGAQFFGKGDHEGIRHTFRFKLYACLILLAGAFALFLTRGEPLIDLYLHEGGETGDIALTMQYAKEYLAISLIGIVPFAVTQIYSGTLRETGRTLPPMIAGLAGVLVNLTLNYVLIFGHFGAPPLGVEGAAIATVISRFVECGAVIFWTHTHKRECVFIKGVYRSLRVPAPLIKKILILGTPLLLNETLWAMGQAALLQSYSVGGIATVSAMNITNTVSNTFAVLYMAVGSAIAILLGHMLGAGETEEAKVSAKKMVAFSLFMGCCAGILIMLCAPFFPLLYNTTHEVRALATSLILVIGGATPIHAFMHSTYFVLRSGGKTIITFLFDSGYVWCVSVVLVTVLMNHTSLPIVAVYAICQFIDIIKCVAGAWLVKRGSWATDLTKLQKSE